MAEEKVNDSFRRALNPNQYEGYYEYMPFWSVAYIFGGIMAFSASIGTSFWINLGLGVLAIFFFAGAVYFQNYTLRLLHQEIVEEVEQRG